MIGAENNIMQFVSCLLDAEIQANLSSKYFMPTDWFSKIYPEMQSSFLSASKDKLKTKGNISLHIRTGDLLTSVLLTVDETLPTHVLQGTSFIDKYILTNIPDEHKACI